MIMTKTEKRILTVSVVFSVIFGIIPCAGAMHIMEGYLPAGWCVCWYALCVPFFVMGCISINKIIKANPKSKLLLAMAGAFIFVLSAMKLPSVTGRSSHPTGTGLGAILFGPWVIAVLGVIVLLFQAVLLAHGGITTLGANTFSMAIVGPIVGYAIYKLIKVLKGPKWLAIFLGAFFADLSTYVVTAFQLAAAHPAQVGGFGASFVKFLGIFAVTQVPLAVSEGILTVLIMKALEAYDRKELVALGVCEEKSI